MTGLLLGGRVPFSTVDMPGRNAAVLFCQGCPWRCRYCHNAHLRPRSEASLAWEETLRWLEPRRGFLDAVVFSGGEPLLQPGLGAAMAQVKAMGYEAGLHTGGCDPLALEAVLPLADWVGLDIKAPRHAYDLITGVPGSGHAAWESLERTLRSGVSHEIRTTCHLDLLSEADLVLLAGSLAEAGAKVWTLQAFRGQGCADAALAASPGAALGEASKERLQAVFLGEGPESTPRPRHSLMEPRSGTTTRRFLAR